MKKVFSLLIIGLFFLSIDLVKAKNITLDELKETMEKNFINEKVEITDGKLVVNRANNHTLTFNIDNNILSTTNTYSKNSLESAKDLHIFLNITKVVAYLKGYSYIDIKYFLTNIYDARMEIEGYKVDIINTNDNTTITYKIDLNNFKLIYNYIEASKPNIIIDNKDNKRIDLKVTNDEDGEILLYRSFDNENYEYVTTLYVKDGFSAMYSDDNVNKNNYYKAVVAKSNNFSDVAVVKTKDVSDDSYLDEKANSPMTGYQEFVGVSMLIIIAIIGVVNNINLRKKVIK